MPKFSLNKIDLKILSHLQNNARLTNVELSEHIHLSQSPCLRRVRNMESSGIIQGYVALVDQNAVGLPVSVFVNVRLEKQIERALEKFEEIVQDWSEVMECYLMTGDSDYLLRVVASDLAAYERFLMDKLTRVPGVASINSSFALKQVTYKTALPI
jgi:Lrp/AsnC family leucine-responsive transcriptional regulator|tara:strand:- start:226 stop:693 length:468 start_codon:yes stop_codon:yes gene_type:complete